MIIPTIVPIHPDEHIVGWIERLAEANNMSTDILLFHYFNISDEVFSKRDGSMKWLGGLSRLADIDIGMGDAEFKDCKFFKSNFEVGMSDFDYEGYLGAETNIRCGMGNADFVLDGKRSDYHIEGKKVSGKDNEDGILINVDSGVSDVDINFKK